MTRLLFASALALGLVAGFNRAAQNPKDVHDPANAVANLDVYPELKATLFASEPMLTNPTNLDIDHRGRVWICDVKNYRGNNGKRPEGDRILILEDTNGDGVADTVKTFYQGRDIDSTMGICVLGNKVIVSAPSNILVFTFDENDKVLKKEFLFKKTGNPQHDHSSHSFVFGPDGRLYWNFGNEGRAVHDKDGKPVVDLAGNAVNDRGQPYRQGMVFRCDMDGKNFEVLGHNFRNNYEAAVDSFGTVWQSDNDDDGNRGVRINYVMEYGNFGYVDELTGAGWQAKRTNMETEIPLRHWHLNDPGVVPNLLQTGGGSPTGICVYEGTLLPKVFHNQIIHCDAGPSIVRSYPVVPDGAGYKVTQTVNILDGSKRNNWFRPADVCTAPDGSIFVTDWYDPGVGGHGQRDLDRGRIFRVAPPGVKYRVPKTDFGTLEGCAEALKSPNLATRHIAWTKLHEAGAKAEPALQKLWKSANPRERARALWLLGRIPDGRDFKGYHYLLQGLQDPDPNIRIVGIRLHRQRGMSSLQILTSLHHDGIHPFYADPSPAVRRECALALAQAYLDPAPVRPQRRLIQGAQWAFLARHYEGKDRWQLEALGIGAAGNWDACLDAYATQELMAWGIDKQPFRDIIWRSRGKRTPDLLAMLITNQKTPPAEMPRMLRAFDFQAASDAKQKALLELAFGDLPADRQAFVSAEALQRLGGLDLNKQPQLAAKLNKLLDQKRGTSTFVELVGKFGLADRYAEALALAQQHATDQLGIDAMGMLMDRDQKALVRKALAGDKEQAIATAQALGSAGHDRATELLLPLVQDAKLDLELRRQAARALARNKVGAQQLIKLAAGKKLDEGVKIAAGSALSVAPWKDLQRQIAKLFPAPAGKDNRPLPAITQLVKLKGNAASGKIAFAKAGTCAKCHVVNGEGKEVGPNLSEIGKKLSKEAIYESILFPSASISHNYETYVVETKAGGVVSGLLVSKTPADITLKDAESLQRTFKTGDVESVTRSPISLMPADLHKALTTQDLADLVEYLLTLREARQR